MITPKEIEKQIGHRAEFYMWKVKNLYKEEIKELSIRFDQSEDDIQRIFNFYILEDYRLIVDESR